LPFRPFRVPAAALAAVLFVAFARGLSSQAPAGSQLTLLTKDGRRSLPTVIVGSQEFVALDDLASTFQVTVHDEQLGNITVSYKGKTIVLTPDQALASVAGRLVSLPAAPTRSGRRWLVPVDFINRALGLIYDARLDLRKPSHLLVVGDLRVPRITARYEPLGSAGRLTLDAVPRANAEVSQDADRLAIKYDADALDAPAPLLAPQPAGSLVQSLRVVDPVTIVVELAPRTTLRAASQPSDGSTRLTIDLTAAATTEPQPSAPQPGAAPGPPELPPAFSLGPQPAGLRTLVIDAGHGGEDAGVKGAGGVKEKDVALAVARRLKTAVEGRLGIRVVMTRDDDRNVGVDDRAAIANNNKADIFISLHANASFRKSAAGLTIYTASFGANAEAVKTQAPERLPAFGGGLREIELLPWDVAQTRHLNQSTDFAKILREQLQGHLVPLSPLSLQQAPLRVLEPANMPAVLVEMGYLSNPEQEAKMGTPEFQGAVAQSLFEAILRFKDGGGGGSR
jgi:N-acetylmuramoyl-L-alanine amidase